MGFLEPSKGEMPEIDDGLHNVTCVAVKEVTVEQDQFGNFEKIQLTVQFEDFVDGEGNPITLDPRCNAKWSERATLYKWSLAFNCGGNPDSRFNTDSFKGKKARALIEVPRNEEGEQTGWPRVKEFLKRASAPSQAAPAPSKKKAHDVDENTTLADWWSWLQGAGFKREEIEQRSLDTFGRIPMELDGEERLTVFQGFIK